MFVTQTEMNAMIEQHNANTAAIAGTTDSLLRSVESRAGGVGSRQEGEQ